MLEIDFIKKYIEPLVGNNSKDDTFYFTPETGCVISSDSIAEGTHFLKECRYDLIAKKALRVNLSDIAASGSEPYGFSLNLFVPKGGLSCEKWDMFFNGLREDIELFKCKLIGGDTITHNNDTFMISITIFGKKSIPPLGRQNAKHGELLCVTNYLGDAALGLMIESKKISFHGPNCSLRYNSPIPRIEEGKIISRFASACMDISDGLAIDAQKMASASCVMAKIFFDSLPISKEFQSCLKSHPEIKFLPLNGGDDYELLFCIDKKNINTLKSLNVQFSVIGEIVNGSGVKILDNGMDIRLSNFGYSHKI